MAGAGWGDGDGDGDPVQGLLDNLKEQFLHTFNLTGSGGGGVRVEPPEYMMELYNRFANDHSAMPTANIIRSFKNEGEGRPLHAGRSLMTAPPCRSVCVKGYQQYKLLILSSQSMPMQ